jgi:hypothetical protein
MSERGALETREPVEAFEAVNPPRVGTVSAASVSTAPGGGMTYTPVVPTFSPHTADAAAAVRLAWRWTLAAFAFLVLLVVGGPLARNWYVGAAIEPQPAQMMSIDGGIVFVQRRGAGDWVMAKPDDQIAPGDALRTAANSRAFLRLVDQSTVLVYPSTTLRILRDEQGRFRREKLAVVLELTQGRARIGVAPPADPSATFFQLRTPSAAIHLDEGSYSADVDKGVTQVAVRLGTATAYTAHGTANANTGQRLTAPADQTPSGNLPARRDLVDNGLFAEKDAEALSAWTVRDLSDFPTGTVSLTAIPGAVTFRRNGSGHGETLVMQTLDTDLWDFDKVTVSANVRVLSHNLSGGGWLGFEYPLMLRVVYRDITGGTTTWFHGFYLQNADGYPTRDAERLPSTDWQHVDIDLLSLVPRPWRIQRVEIVASGWDYTSAVNEFHIWAE